ncbi:hypothetical protein J3R83DRAFT_12682 [Lanmaoa asiatica]|nr:hypothetical protein J3R83DRAFT_12682 [Lanmaoa asiatica]
MATIDSTLGALFIGFRYMASLSSRCTTIMVDILRIKLGIKQLLLGTLHEVFVGHAVYYYSITNFLNVHVLSGNPIWCVRFFFFPLFSSFDKNSGVKFLTFSGVAFELSMRTFPSVMGFLHYLLLQTYESVGLSCVNPPIADLLFLLQVLGLISLGAGALNDIGVAASLCYYLQTMRSSYAQTNSLIRNLTLNAVNTGALTRYCWTSTMLFSIWLTPLSSALSCCTMIMVSIACSLVLNTRQIIRGRGTECDAKRFSMATDQRRYSHSVPLHSPTVFGDPLDVEFHGGEDKGVSAPGLDKGLVVPRPPDSGSTAQGDNPNIIFTQDRPDNTAGW